MSDTVQAGTPTPTPDDRPAGTPVAPKDDSGLNAQQQKEYLTLKQKAEDYNKLEAALREKDAQIQELARRAYGGGQAATDPRAELVQQLREQASYDPVAQATLLNMEDAAIARAEAWLAQRMTNVPDAKRAQVADYIRTKGYQVDETYAMKMLADPEAQTLAQRLAETQAELDRLKGAKPNGTSAAFAPSATTSADDGRVQETIKRADYQAILARGGANGASDEDREAARALMRAVGSNKTKFED